ncbi:hypothetical protein E2C01_058633 [Portunus trituberculatus]|uniref:Uncharacterized protein n=1 Tax=Portunus trituberculatus TaxID=210409 RepID=A0A5B7H3Q3_PORTR|nr:hypothetical protein [Portunus trituberculatus]
MFSSLCFGGVTFHLHPDLYPCIPFLYCIQPRANPHALRLDPPATPNHTRPGSPHRHIPLMALLGRRSHGQNPSTRRARDAKLF